MGTWNGAWPQGSYLQSPRSAGWSGLMGRKVGHVVGYMMEPGLEIRTSSSESLPFSVPLWGNSRAASLMPVSQAAGGPSESYRYLEKGQLGC